MNEPQRGSNRRTFCGRGAWRTPGLRRAEVDDLAGVGRIWWPRHDVRECSGGLKTLPHRVLGPMTLEYTGLQVTHNSDLRLVVHTRLL